MVGLDLRVYEIGALASISARPVTDFLVLVWPSQSELMYVYGSVIEDWWMGGIWWLSEAKPGNGKSGQSYRGSGLQ